MSRRFPKWLNRKKKKEEVTNEATPTLTLIDVPQKSVALEQGEQQQPPPQEDTPLLRKDAPPESNRDPSRSIVSNSLVRFQDDNKIYMRINSNISDSVRSMSRHAKHFVRQLSGLVEEHVGTIGYLGSYAIAVNSLTGPAMLELPATFATCGLIPTVCTLLFVGLLSALCSLHMANCISKVQISKNDKPKTNRKKQQQQSSLLNNDTFGDEEMDSQLPQARRSESDHDDDDDDDDDNIMNGQEHERHYNHDFKAEVEFSAVFSSYWGYQPWYYVTQSLFWICITCLNISSIVDTAQVVDTILGHTIGTWALQMGIPGMWGNDSYDTIISIKCVGWDAQQCSTDELQGGHCLPFLSIIQVDDGTILFTLGAFLTTACFLPLAIMDLKENAFMQSVAFLVLMFTSLQFILQFALDIILDHNTSDSISNSGGGDDDDLTRSILSSEEVGDVSNGHHVWYSHESLWGHSWEDLFGVVLFNFALVIAVPAWLYEREPHVDVPTVVYGSSCLAAFLYIAIGWLGHLAVPHVSSNFLASLMSGAYGKYMQLGASVFAFFIVGLGIPLFSVLTRLNLIGSSGKDQPALCTRPVANVLAVYFPFAASWFLYDGHSITKLLSWGGILFTSVVAFILPLSLAIHVTKTSSAPGSVSVYGSWLTSRRGQLNSLRVLLLLAFVSITFAIVGNII